MRRRNKPRAVRTATSQRNPFLEAFLAPFRDLLRRLDAPDFAPPPHRYGRRTPFHAYEIQPGTVLRFSGKPKGTPPPARTAPD